MPSPPAAPAPEPDTRPWVDRYRDFIHSIVPEGWTFRIRGGIGYQSSTSRSRSYSFGFEGRKNWADVNEFAMFANYDYAVESPEHSPSYTSTEKLVASALYKRYIASENNWFVSNTLSYSYDKIKGINNQADEIVAVGYTFKFLDGEIVLNISTGPSVRFINAVDYDHNWVLMGTVMEDMTWRFHKYARLEQRQSAFAGFNAMNPEEYNLIFNIGIIFEISDLLHIAGRYSYNYDGINAATAQKADQRLTLGFEIPLK